MASNEIRIFAKEAEIATKIEKILGINPKGGMTPPVVLDALRLIKEHRLQPLARQIQHQYLQAVTTIPNTDVSIVKAKAIETKDTELQILWHGGMKKPHLHYDGEIYLLNGEQWSKIASDAVEKLGNSLAKARNISFDSFIKIAEAVEEVT